MSARPRRASNRVHHPPRRPGAGQPPATPPAPLATAPAGSTQAPWDRDGVSYDPARAWALIEHLRAERDAARAGQAPATAAPAVPAAPAAPPAATPPPAAPAAG